MLPSEPLQYPPHFPPDGKWKCFFIGVRWLGPDTSFFSDLRAAQNARSLESKRLWGGGERQALAVAMGEMFATYCRWPTPYFLPDDHVAVIAGGASFGWLDHTDVDEAIGAVEEIVGTKMTPAFWKAAGSGTLGQLVDQLVAAASPDRAFKPTSPQDCEFR